MNSRESFPIVHLQHMNSGLRKCYQISDNLYVNAKNLKTIYRPNHNTVIVPDLEEYDYQRYLTHIRSFYDQRYNKNTNFKRWDVLYRERAKQEHPEIFI